MTELNAHLSDDTENTKSSDPFGEDKLERNQFNNFFCNLIKSYKNATIALSGEWGSGKTTFLTMCKKELETERYSTLYLNAWENDTLNSPLVCIAGTLQELETQSSKEYRDFINYLDKVTPKILKGIGYGATKLILGGKVTDEVIEALKEIGNSSLQHSIHSFNEQKEARKQMKESLESYINTVSNNKPLIFFIDELDRCRPDFAVELLEYIKHLFSIKNIVFVIAIDKVQLCSSIKGYYGSDTFNAHEYLKRFFDLEIKLPQGSKEKFIETRLIKQYLPERTSCEKAYGDKIDMDILNEFLCKFLTLRDLDRLFAELSLIIRGCGYSRENGGFLIFLLLIKLHFPQLYTTFKNRDVDLKDFFRQCEMTFTLESIEDNARYKRLLSFNILDLMIVYSSNKDLKKEDERMAFLHEKLPEIANFIDREFDFSDELRNVETILEYSNLSID